MRIEQGAELGYARKIPVADNLGLRIGLLQVFEQEPKCCLLFRGAGVGITAMSILATDVANANGVLVVVLDVGTGKLLGTAGMDRTILVDDPVVAAAGPTLGLVEVVEVFDRDLLVHIGVGAVNDNPLDVLHREHFFHVVTLITQISTMLDHMIELQSCPRQW